MEVALTIHSLDGAKEIPLSENRLTIGRTPAADLVINDQSLSSVHASINRDGDRIWLIDEGSTNGSFVNGEPVPPNGTPLRDGDEIYLGESTIVVTLKQSAGSQSDRSTETPAIAAGASGLPMPMIAAAAGVVIILFAVIVIGLAYRNSGGNEQITVKKYSNSPGDNGDSANTAPVSSPGTQSNVTTTPATIHDAESESPPGGPSINTTKRYLAMSSDEQRQFVQNEAQHVARMIGNREGYAFTPEVVSKIKIWVDAYAHRLNSPKPSGGCNMHHDLSTLLNRAHANAPLVVKAFNEKGLSPQVGLYLAMIEAEYCSCLSSGTGPKGYFQFASSTARRYGVQDVSSPKDTRPDDRCKIEIMSPIAAQYMKDLIAMFGTGPLSVPLAIASYNEGEGGLNANLMKALNAARTSDNPERSFWTLVAHEQILSDQFQRENIKYVPHFFGAAIVGENPRVFGVELEPISSYTQQPSNSAAPKSSD
jgi:pSer/pThr/pTyr-binding forkhead associated (FHA) protein